MALLKGCESVLAYAGKEKPGIQTILEGFIHMLSSSTTATGMSLATDPSG